MRTLIILNTEYRIYLIYKHVCKCVIEVIDNNTILFTRRLKLLHNCADEKIYKLRWQLPRPHSLQSLTSVPCTVPVFLGSCSKLWWTGTGDSAEAFAKLLFHFGWLCPSLWNSFLSSTALSIASVIS